MKKLSLLIFLFGFGNCFNAIASVTSTQAANPPASTAMAFSATPTNCGANSFATGINASGNALGCTASANIATPSTLVARDFQGNTALNNIYLPLTITVSSGGTTTLLASSTNTQQLTGTLNQTFILPNTVTIAIGWNFVIDNDSTGILTIKDFGGTTIFTMPAGQAMRLVLEDATTTSGIWDGHINIPDTWTAGDAGMVMIGSLVSTIGSCSGVVDGICSGYSTGLASIGGGAADATQIAANGVQTALFDQYGRLRTAQLGTVPTITSGNCGAATNGTISAGGTDQNFTLNIGAAATTTCIVNFSVAWTTAPRNCLFSAASAGAAASAVLPWSGVPSTTTWTLTGAVLASTVWNVHCQ